jgi:hypothetical protein
MPESLVFSRRLCPKNASGTILRKLALLRCSGTRQVPITIAWRCVIQMVAIQKEVNREEYCLFIYGSIAWPSFDVTNATSTHTMSL